MIPLCPWIFALTIGGTEAPSSPALIRNPTDVPNIEAMVGLSWNQPTEKEIASPALGNRLGLSFETPGIGVGKAGHLDISAGIAYSTRSMALKGDFDRATFSLLQFPILGHGPIMGLPWLEAAAGFTPGWVFDYIHANATKGYVDANREVKVPFNCDITVGVIARLGVFRFRVLLYNNPVANLRDNSLVFTGFLCDAHIPLHWKHVP